MEDERADRAGGLEPFVLGKLALEDRLDLRREGKRPSLAVLRRVRVQPNTAPGPIDVPPFERQDFARRAPARGVGVTTGHTSSGRAAQMSVGSASSGGGVFMSSTRSLRVTRDHVAFGGSNQPCSIRFAFTSSAISSNGASPNRDKGDSISSSPWRTRSSSPKSFRQRAAALVHEFHRTTLQTEFNQHLARQN
jgi:hypothetical protein